MFNSPRGDIAEITEGIRALLPAQEQLGTLQRESLAIIQEQLTRIELATRESVTVKDLREVYGYLDQRLKELKDGQDALRSQFTSLTENQRTASEGLELSLQQTAEKIGGLFPPLHAEIEKTGGAVENFYGDWQASLISQPDEETPQGEAEWLEDLASELRRLGASGGMLRLFAKRYFNHVKQLRGLDKRLTAEPAANWADRLEELHRTVFSPDLGITWNQFGPHNCTQAQRNKLRQIEGGVLEYRNRVQAKLAAATGIVPLEIVPEETRFDAKLHETSDYLSVATADAAKDNIIVSVERPGYMEMPRDGSPSRLLQTALVRRLLYAAPAMATPDFAAPKVTEPDDFFQDDVSNNPQPTTEVLADAPSIPRQL